ncbi:hypothetical protein M9458_051930 [Cirrhinus mrigala]|uniref:Capsid protein n=1 Tax=Cirrhinus mrigala TaxID=683832 RepID=A0ABD0MQ64_CIRMR
MPQQLLANFRKKNGQHQSPAANHYENIPQKVFQCEALEMRCTILSYFTFHNGELTIRFRQGHSNIVKVLARRIIYGETPSLHRILFARSRLLWAIQMACLSGGLWHDFRDNVDSGGLWLDSDPEAQPFCDGGHFVRRSRFRRRIRHGSRGWRRRKYVRRRRRFRNRYNYWRFRAIKHDHLTWTSSTGLATGLTFQLTDVSYPKGYWDYYKIKKVVVQIWPESNNVPINKENNKVIYGSTVIDYDDATLSTTSTDPYKDYSTRKLFIHNRVHIRVFTPRPNIELYKSTSVSNYGFLNVTSGPWINAAHDGIPHYGMKIWLPPQSNATSGISFKLIIKYYVVFRNRM